MIFRGTSQKECSGLQKGFPVESWLIGGGFRAFVVPLQPSLPPAHRKTRGPVWLHVSLKNSSRVRKMSIVMIFESKKWTTPGPGLEGRGEKKRKREREGERHIGWGPWTLFRASLPVSSPATTHQDPHGCSHTRSIWVHARWFNLRVRPLYVC